MNKISLLVLAGAAAFLYHKYSKMSDSEKKDMVNNLKSKGKKLYDQYVPSNVKDTAEKFV